MFWYDGGIILRNTLELEVNNPGLLYGATVFTTMRVYGQSLIHPLTNWQAHYDRLQHSLDIFGWQQPDWTRLKQGAELLLNSFSVLRMAVFPDGKEWIIGRNLPPDLTQRQQQGITAWVAEDSIYRRNLAQHKTGNYLSAYLARQKALQVGAKEAILIDSNGNWLETSTGNLWGYKNGSWYSPALDSGILPGIGRSQLLNFLRQENIPVQENIWTPNFIQELDAIAYSNCVVEIIPIVRILSSANWLNFLSLSSKISSLRDRFFKTE